MGDFIARLKGYKAIRITFCWQNNFSQRQGTLLLLVLQFPPCLCLVFPHLYFQVAKLFSWLYFNVLILEESKSKRFSVYFNCIPEKLCTCSTLFLVFIQHYSLILCLSLPCPQKLSAAAKALSKWASLCLEKWGEQEKKIAVCKLSPSTKWSVCAKWHHSGQLQTHRNHYFLPLFSLHREFKLLWTKTIAVISTAS